MEELGITKEEWKIDPEEYFAFSYKLGGGKIHEHVQASGKSGIIYKTDIVIAKIIIKKICEYYKNQ